MRTIEYVIVHRGDIVTLLSSLQHVNILCYQRNIRTWAGTVPGVEAALITVLSCSPNAFRELVRITLLHVHCKYATLTGSFETAIRL